MTPPLVLAQAGNPGGLGTPGELFGALLGLVSFVVWVSVTPCVFAFRSLAGPRVLLAWNAFVLGTAVRVMFTCDHVRGCGRWQWPVLLAFVSLPVVLFGVLRLDDAPNLLGERPSVRYAMLLLSAALIAAYVVVVLGGYSRNGWPR